MHFTADTLRNTGLILIIIGLVLAWLLVIFRYLLNVNEQKVNTRHILSAHLDYLFMGIILIGLSIIDNGAASWLIGLACLGAITNPLLFVVQAFHPKNSKKAQSPFGMISTLSFIITTVGIGGLCVSYLEF